ncbi:MAG: phosphatidylserine/phosphatidylglycerophosphate/cardiolipin synthase family protein, partial [Thermoleophilia bacterium]|nr:phosphatidylserine/phosphatidylglycerophosphate/cardiolipin synthase family protein [Thermoleophilia bacterium]
DTSAFIHSSKGTEMAGEVFLLSEPLSKDAFTAVSHDTKLNLLVDPEYGPKAQKVLGRLPNTDVTSYGKMPNKNHAKIFHTGTESLITTGAFTSKTAERYEFVVHLTGDTAVAAREVTESAISGNKTRMAKALDVANEHGIALNDATTGKQLLTQRLHQMIGGAQHELTISTKIYTDPTVRHLVDQAAARGVNVLFTDIRAQGMHGTLVMADNDIYLGTAHLSPRALGDMRLAYRKAREVGVFVRDAGVARDMRARLDMLGMVAYQPQEFEKSRGAFEKMDVVSKLKDQQVRLGDSPELKARIDQALIEKIPAEASWRETTNKVRDARKADGITFSLPQERQALLDSIGPVDARAVDPRIAARIELGKENARIARGGDAGEGIKAARRGSSTGVRVAAGTGAVAATGFGIWKLASK